MNAADRIFINYRRADTRWAASRLYDGLSSQIGADRLFMDVDSIPPGADFVEYLNAYVDRSMAIVVLIGPHWLDLRDENGVRRIEDPDDFVNIEINRALERDVLVLPVLIDDAEMPSETDLPEGLKGLARRQAVRLDHETYGQDMRRLVDALGGKPTRRKAMSAKPQFKSLLAITSVALITAFAAISLFPVSGSSSDRVMTPIAVPQSLQSGLWSSDYGDMHWAEDGASFAKGEGRIKGSFDGQTFRGYWAEETSEQPCENERSGTVAWGHIVLTFDPSFEFFHGLWGYCDAEPSMPWTGMRG